MMDDNNFEIWKPVEYIPEDLFFYDLATNTGQVIVSLRQLGVDDKTLRITFSGVLSYRITQESGRYKTLYENSTLRGFRTATDSEFLRWFKREGSGIFDDWDLTHYFICNLDNIIDIISGPPVKSEWIIEG